MIGYFDEYNHPRVDLSLLVNNKKIDTSALIDIGFDGYLSLPRLLAEKLELRFADTMNMELADGVIKKFDLYEIKIIFDNEEKFIHTLLTNSGDILIGTALLMNKRLEIDFKNKIIQIL